MPPVNVAVIGSGFMGAAHVDALRRVPGVNVVAIASMDFPRAKELAAQFGITNVFDDWKALLGRDDVHAVHNCTPNNLHFEVNKAFLEAGKHVLSEKPLTMTSAESGELVRLARQTGVPGSTYDDNDDQIHCVVTTRDAAQHEHQFTITGNSELIGPPPLG